MKIITQLIPKNALGRRPGLMLKPTFITVHSTANVSSTAKNEADNICNNHPEVQSSFHYVVGETEAYQVIPDNEVAWHAGDGFKGKGNRNSLAIEMVETGDREKVLRNTISLVVALMKKYDISIEEVVMHRYWTHKDCPRILRNAFYIKGEMNWPWFIKELKKAYNSSESDDAFAWAVELGLFSNSTKDEPVTYSALAEILYKLQRGGK